MPIALALVAGGLATINPCGFALLPALLSFYVGAEDKDLPSAPTRLLQGLFVGLVVSAGFLAVFAAVGIPISLGAREVTEAIPWAGVVLGAAMALIGLWVLSGRGLSLPIRHSMTARRERRPRAMFLFGVGYGVASLGCTLPVFLALIGASLASQGPLAGLAVFGAYAFGMATVLMALSLGAALLRAGLARALKRLLPHMHRITGAFLLLVGVYLAYYWSTALFAPIGRLSSDPLLSFVQRFTNWVQRLATTGGGRWLILSAGLVVAVTAAVGMWQWSKRSDDSETGRGEPETEAPLQRPESQRVEASH